LREAALKTVSQVGDSTTSSTVMAKAFVDKAEEFIKAGNHPCHLKEEIDDIVPKIMKLISKAAKPANESKLEQVATVSANNDKELGKLVADTFKRVGQDGVIVVQESPTTETFVETINGMQFDRGYESPAFITSDTKNECMLENPYILITEQKILYMRDLVPILEEIIDTRRPLLIIAEHYDPEVIENLKRNMLMGVLKVCAVKAPSYGVYRKDMLEDLAVLTGGTCLTYDSDLYVHNMTADMLGTCKKVIVTKDSTTIIEGNSDPEKIANRIELIRDSLQNCEGEFLTEHHKMRLARLCSGISRIYVGGKTELEMKERKDRVDDAVCAIKAASEEGIVAGGGVTYLGIYLSLFDQIEVKNKGFEILTCGLISIFAKILENAGKDFRNYIDEVDPSKGIGIDVRTMETVNMLKKGIVDPAKACRLAFENALSVLNLYLNTNCVIVNEKIQF
jgi:chaperonin GroEL